VFQALSGPTAYWAGLLCVPCCAGLLCVPHGCSGRRRARPRSSAVHPYPRVTWPHVCW